jgi:hypothetical protein
MKEVTLSLAITISKLESDKLVLNKRIAELEKERAIGVYHFTIEEYKTHNLEQQSIGIESCAVELERCYDVAVQEHGNFDEAETLEQLLDCIRKLKGGAE